MRGGGRAGRRDLVFSFQFPEVQSMGARLRSHYPEIGQTLAAGAPVKKEVGRLPPFAQQDVLLLVSKGNC